MHLTKITKGYEPMKKVVFFAAILTAILTSLSSCASETEGKTEIQSGSAGIPETVQTAETVTETESNTVLDDLGDFNFDGYTFTMLTPDPEIMNWANPVLNATETNGIRLNDAIYERNRSIESRFNMVFEEEYGSWDIGVNNLRTIVEADDNSYDIVTMIDRFALNALAENLLIPYNEIPHVDLTKPYWGAEMLKYSSIGGKHYFAFGDFSLYAYDNTSALLFNKSLIKNYTLENPYELVRTKKWTLDKFSELCSVVTGDTDGDTVMTEKDLYGYLSMPKQVLPSIWIAGGALSIAKDEMDHPVLNFEDERFVSLIEKAFSVTWDTGTWYQNDIQSDIDDTLEKMFINSHGLFHDSTFHKIQRLRDMDADFGIIPYPMADEAQDAYYSRVSGALFSTIPSTSRNLETQGVILEALASESRKSVIPIYYEVSLKGRNTRDEESQEMLDLIFSGRVYDLGDSFWCDDIRDNFIKKMFVKNDRNLSSNVASYKKSLSKKISRIIEQITAPESTAE